MVVEDDVLMCDELLDMLTKAGYRAVKPDEFDNIIEQILDMAPDILLLDINLPGRSGFWPGWQMCSRGTRADRT